MRPYPIGLTIRDSSNLALEKAQTLLRAPRTAATEPRDMCRLGHRPTEAQCSPKSIPILAAPSV
jgi:hypothetical protein